MRTRIVVVEDDPRTAGALRLYLEHGGYDVAVVASGTAALERAGADPPDLFILDVMLPGVDGLEVCRTLRAQSEVPIIMLTARSTEDDTLRGLEAGADDYVTKPFSPRELVARVGVVLRRARPGPRVITIGPVVIDLANRTIRRHGRIVSLTATEFRLLHTLAAVPGRAFTRGELAERVLAEASDALERTIDAHVMNLRRKVEPDRTTPTVVVTVFGVGYRLGTPDGH